MLGMDGADAAVFQTTTPPLGWTDTSYGSVDETAFVNDLESFDLPSLAPYSYLTAFGDNSTLVEFDAPSRPVL